MLLGDYLCYVGISEVLHTQVEKSGIQSSPDPEVRHPATPLLLD